MAEQRVSSIDILQMWDISPAVRDLQVIMKDLWYFDYNDTAIYWEKTRQSVFEYQVDKWLLALDTDTWAWVCGPVTKASLKDDLKDDYLEELAIDNNISTEELVVSWISTF
jgi:ornithine carbamoyltransferase